MVSEILQRELHAFVDEVGELLGIDVERPSQAVLRRVQAEYLPRALTCDEPTKRRVLQVFRSAWRDNVDHGNRRRFGRAMVNVTRYCLIKTDIIELDDQEVRHATDSVVRLAGWYHTHCNLFLGFSQLQERQ